VYISGVANKLEARTSSGSDLRGSELRVRDAELVSSGGSDISIHVDNTLEAKASGGSDIKYSGDPTIINLETSSSSDIVKRDF
jgi:hypothetical protein